MEWGDLTEVRMAFERAAVAVRPDSKSAQTRGLLFVVFVHVMKGLVMKVST